MASYLLNADDADMERWKECARQRRVNFAVWLRQAAEVYAAMPPSVGPPSPPKTVTALPRSSGLASRR